MQQPEIGIAREHARRLLADPWLQRALLVAVLVYVFLDGIWAGVPRSDQILYLHHISQYDSLWDILSHSPSWNRTATDLGGDVILYRPVLYLLLGTFYYLFRYNFVAWQIASLCLHIVVVLGLHLLLLQGRLRATLYPLVIALLFGTAFLGSELVLWNNVVGYLLFSVLDVYAVYFFLRFLQTDRTAFLLACGGLGLVAEFTYEMGALVNLLFAATLLARSWSARAPKASLIRRTDGRFALMFVLTALLLPAASLFDLRVRGVAFAPHLQGVEAWGLATLVGENMARQFSFWIRAWLAPTTYQVLATPRAFARISTSGLTGLTLLNLIALVWLLVAGVRALILLRRGGASMREPGFAVASSVLFLLGYSLVISIGRTRAQVADIVVHANIYYGYVAYLAVCVGIAAAAAAARLQAPAAASAGAPQPDRARAAAGVDPTARFARLGWGLVVPLAIITFANACGVRALARAYRYDFAVPRQQVIDRVLAWQRQAGEHTPRYFAVSPACQGDDALWWFTEALLRKGSGWKPPVTLADALWPERSAPLNAARIPIPFGSVDELRCDQGPPSPRNP